MLSFPRCHTREPDKARVGSPPGGSTFSTRAPWSARSIPVIGPAMPWDRSRTVRSRKTADMRSPACSDGGNGALDVFGQRVDEATLVGPHHLVGDA